MSRGFASNGRIALLFGTVLACLALVGVRLVFLHVIDRGQLLNYIEQVRKDVVVEHARRGNIYDSRGHLLATSEARYIVGVDPQMVRKEDEARWPQLAALLGVPLAEITQRFETKTQGAAPAQGAAATAGATWANLFRAPAVSAPAADSSTAADPLEQDTVADAQADASGRRAIHWAKLKEDVRVSVYDQVMALKIKGVYGNRVFRRVYPHDSLAAKLIGYVNREGDAAAGVERYADFYLRGHDGWWEGERDGKRHLLAQFKTREVKPEDGYDVMLSIDLVIQQMVAEELASIAGKLHPKYASIIVSDARTGFILAMGTTPTFDLNDYSRAPMDAQRNFAITDQYDPGSTFKVVTVSAALDAGLVQPGTRFNCSIPGIDYQGVYRRFMPDDEHYDHPLSVAEIIKYSSNIGAAQLGMVLGPQRLYDYARAYGFGEKEGFPFGGEISGMLNPVSEWRTPAITRIPAGYGVSVTPLQMHYAMATIASGGLLFRPQIIKEIRDDAGRVVYRFGSAVRRRVISEGTARTMARILSGVTQAGGTADNVEIPGYQVAGKTGTAQILVDGHYSRTNHVASFVGFFPASDPRVVMSVVVNDAHMPNGAVAYGRAAAAPSFKRLAVQLIQYMDIRPPEQIGQRLVAMGGGLR